MTGESQLPLANKQLYKARVLKQTKGPIPVCIEMIWPTSPATCFALNNKCPLLTCLMKKSNVLSSFSILSSVTFTVQENTFQTWPNHVAIGDGSHMHFSSANKNPNFWISSLTKQLNFLASFSPLAPPMPSSRKVITFFLLLAKTL